LTPNATYDIVVHSTPVTVGSVTTDASGSANYTLTVPSGLPAGAHTVQFVDANGTVGASLAFTISSLANAGSSSSLSNTGTDSKLGIELGLLLIAGGSMLVFAFRRRPRGKHIS
jgi:protein-tyrosine phosphatase